MDERDIATVAAAFDRLLAHAARTCDQTVTWPIAAAKGDILDILAGQWHSDEAADSDGYSDDDDDMTQGEYDRLADLLLDGGLPYGLDAYESSAYAMQWGM